MSRSRVLIIGADGQVGWELRRTLSSLGDVIPYTRNDLDLASIPTIRRKLIELRPNLIVNAAAYTAVDDAEDNIGTATQINAIAPKIIAEETQRLGAGLVHFSTDYVFDGLSNCPYTEIDSPNPVNWYGITKLQGEKLIESVGVPSLIIRTSWVYGARRRNFFRTMLKLGLEKEEIRVVNDQLGCPTSSSLIAEVTAQILNLADSRFRSFLQNHGGIYHVTAVGPTTWYDFARTIFEKWTQKVEQTHARIVPTATENYPTRAKRPRFSVLDNAKVQHTFGIKAMDWKSDLDRIIESYPNSQY